MKQSRGLRTWIAIVAALALIGAACGRPTTSESPSAAAAAVTTVETPAATPSVTTTVVPTPLTTATTEPPPEPCIPSGDQSGIQNALNAAGSKAVLCEGAMFELSDTIYFTADSQQIYTRGFPTDDSRALLRVVGKDVAIAVAGGHYNKVALRNVIIDGNRPQMGIAEGALIDYGRGIEDVDVQGQVVEWVKAYEPRGWTVLHLNGPCTGAVARNNEFGPAGQAEYLYADGISLECPNSVVENNTIVDATDGGIVIFQSPGSLVANNTIRTENQVMFYGISMIDYYPLEGDFTGTRVTGNIIDAAGGMIRNGIAMGPHVGCIPEGEILDRSRGAVVTDNVLKGDHMGYGFVVSGVEDWTVTGNVDLSTHPAPEREVYCFEDLADPPGGFQMNPDISSGSFQEDFTATPIAWTGEFWTFEAVASPACVAELIGADVLDDIKSGNRGELWPALESSPNGERIGQCMSLYQPPDISDLSGDVMVRVLPCEPLCVELELINLSETETAAMDRTQFMVDAFLVQCHGLAESLGPGEAARCTIEDYVTPGFQVLRWFGFPPDSGQWGFNYPFEAEE